MVKLAGGFTFIYLKDMSKLATFPDVAGASMERVTQRQSGETHVRCVEREFHESRNRVPSFLLMEIQRIVSW